MGSRDDEKNKWPDTAGRVERVIFGMLMTGVVIVMIGALFHAI